MYELGLFGGDQFGVSKIKLGQGGGTKKMLKDPARKKIRTSKHGTKSVKIFFPSSPSHGSYFPALPHLFSLSLLIWFELHSIQFGFLL